MSDSYRFIVFGDLQEGKTVVKTGPFYVKQEHHAVGGKTYPWKIYVDNREFAVTGFVIGGHLEPAETVKPPYIRGVTGLAIKGGLILRNVNWIGDLVDHKHHIMS